MKFRNGASGHALRPTAMVRADLRALCLVNYIDTSACKTIGSLVAKLSNAGVVLNNTWYRLVEEAAFDAAEKA